MKMKKKMILSALVTAYIITIYFLCLAVDTELTNKTTTITKQELK